MSTFFRFEASDEDGGTGRSAALRTIIDALLQSRRRTEESAQDVGAEPAGFSDERVNRILTELLGDGAIVVPDDDEDDPDYQEGQENEEEDDLEGDYEGEEMDEDDDEEEIFNYASYPRSHVKHHEVVTEPKEAGMSLLFSGEFGRTKHQIRSRNKDGDVSKFLLTRSSKMRPPPREDLACDIVPNSNGTAVASYYSNAYVGQYSSDSSFYYTCVRNFRLHIYDTTAPIMPTQPTSSRLRGMRGQMIPDDHDTSMKVIKTIEARPGGWTITDSHLSPDNQRMIYASVSNYVYMASTLDSNPTQTAINFADPPRRNGQYSYDDHYGVWSCKFSADGNEVIAGGTEMVFVYDLLAEKRTVKIKAHEDDINSCCWADTASGNVLVSASDDTFLKVWDRRSLGSSPKPSGVLIGHTEGITYVSAKGDGRYVISNGKDQILRLWDLRKMRSSLEFEDVKDKHYGIPSFDYRRGSYPRPRFKAHPLDCSVMQYTGHEVLRTLIRCHFSPAESTGGQYIYSGSADGRIHIWSLDGRVVQVLDRSATLPMSYDPSDPQPVQMAYPHRRVCVRDVSWHAHQPILMSAGWLGTGWSSNESSVIARHEWKGLSKMQYNIEDWTAKASAETTEREERYRRRQFAAMPGAFEVESD